MRIRDFLKQHFRQRLEQSSCLVFYDLEGRYREIVDDLGQDGCRVIDGSTSTILAREEAMECWCRLADQPDPIRPMLIYLPVRKPNSELERQRNPYQALAIGGSVFPYDDGDGYQALCRKAKPDFQQQVDRLFAAGVPDFDTIDAIDGGANWPKLRSLLKVESSSEILTALLSPSEKQRQALEQDEAWPAELKRFTKSLLGLKLKTKSQKWKPVQEEVARFVLFSEFALDLPEELPGDLKDVPKADASRKDLIYNVCETLRTSQKHQVPYIDMANKAAAELNLEERLKHFKDFGKRDTFAFEERTFLRQFIEMAKTGDNRQAREIVSFRKDSIWVREADRQLLWTVCERGLDLMEAVDSIQPQWKRSVNGLPALFSWYETTFKRVDTLHRSFEQAIGDTYGDLGVVSEFVESARKRYLKFAEEVQAYFISKVEQEGWPPAGLLKQTQVFAKFLAGRLEERRRVAFLLIDAFRFELAAELQIALAKEYPVELRAVAAQLPTTTRVGMAALMPEADGDLQLVRKNNDLIPMLKDKEVKDPKDRLKALQALYGDRCAMLDLDAFLKKKLQLAETVQLLVLKTKDIDDLGEHLVQDAARLIPGVLKKLPAAVAKLKELKFEYIVLTGDHGFILLDEQEPGDLVPKPAGDWIQAKGRYLLGSGSGSPGTAAFEVAHVGIKGEVDTLVVPKSFGTFNRTDPYFHGGLSLQECVLPVLSITARKKEEKRLRPGKLQLSYKGGATDAVTTRRPMIEIALYQEQLAINPQKELQFQLEAHAKGKVVGEAASCTYLDPSTNLVKIDMGQAIKVPLRMDEEFEGTFEVRAIDPGTQANHAALKLKTNYMD